MIKVLLLSITSLMIISLTSIMLKSYLEYKKFELKKNIVFGTATLFTIIQLLVIAVCKVEDNISYLSVALIDLLNLIILIFILLYFIFLGREKGGDIVVRWILPLISILPSFLIITSLFFFFRIRTSIGNSGIESLSEIFGSLSSFSSGILASLIASIVFTVLSKS